jgi:hypothetical protein
MRTHATLLVSGALVPVAMGATMIVHGDWQAALVASAGLTGGAFLLSLTRLLAIGERVAWPARAAAAAPPRAAVVEPVLTGPDHDIHRESTPPTAAVWPTAARRRYGRHRGGMASIPTCSRSMRCG